MQSRFQPLRPPRRFNQHIRLRLLLAYQNPRRTGSGLVNRVVSQNHETNTLIPFHNFQPMDALAGATGSQVFRYHNPVLDVKWVK